MNVMQQAETVKVGIQNNRILRGLFPSLLAATRSAKNETARIQNRGEKKLSRNPPAMAASPVAFEEVNPSNTDPDLGTSSAKITAVNPLRMALT
jgi:hypothetical protein